MPPVEVGELPRDLLAKAMRERRFKPRAARIDSTVVEADVRYRVKGAAVAPKSFVAARGALESRRRRGGP